MSATSPAATSLPLAACTIVSKNYLPFARVLSRSFTEHYPQGRFFLLLVDRNDGYFEPDEEPFEAIYEAESLPNLPDPASFLFKYTILEANTAVKPYFLEHLFDTHGLDKLVYLDPDILITGSLETLSHLLDRHSVVLTPHLTDPIDDGAYPSEQAILQSGTYNLGFVGLRGDATGRHLLSWWQDRLFDRCVVRIADGLFVDQKWMDLAPGLFEDVHVLADPGYNVAYWNLHGRRVVAENGADAGSGDRGGEGGFTCNGRPLVFFHFSGITPENLHPVSKHQDRFTLGDIGDAAELYRIYADLVLDAGFRQCRPWPYAYASFTNGVAIPDAARSLYLELDAEARASFGDPFDAGRKPNFFAHLLGPEGDPLGRFLRFLHHSRADLDFGDLDGPGFQAYADWLLLFGRHELRIPAPFFEALEAHRSEGGLAAAGFGARLRLGAQRLYRSAP
ncbi:MAG: hypothetical protein MI919_17550, partial [Holophagales bacterium]|nr:hypothetical protein [Holophagales bacterium]